MFTPQACIDALLIESVFSLPYAFRYKQPGFFARDPSPRWMSRTTFNVRWHRVPKFVVLIQEGGRGLSPKVRAFCNRGRPIYGRFCRWTSCPYSTSFCPYSQKNNLKRCSDLGYNQPHAVLKFLECEASKGAPKVKVLVANPAIIHSPHHVFETFRLSLVKATGAAQSDFGLVQLHVDRKLPLNWICLSVQRNRLCHMAGPCNWSNPASSMGNWSDTWDDTRKLAGNMGCGHWECSHDYSCGCARFDTIVSPFNVVECSSASWHEAC